jgi:hypothetical protein
MFGGGQPKTDTSAIKRQEQTLRDQENRLKAQEAEQDAAEEERKKKEAGSRSARSGRTGGFSLLSGLETGVAPVSDGKRTQLG